MGLDVALLVAPSHPAEVVGEEVVAFERQERPGEHPIAAHDLADGDGGVVIGGAQRHAAEELEAGHVRGLEGLGALAGIGGKEVGVRVGQRDNAEGGLAPDPGDLDHGLAEVELGVAGRVARAGRRPPSSGASPTATAVWTWE